MTVSAVESTNKIEPQKSLLSNAHIRAYAALAAGRALQPRTFEPSGDRVGYPREGP